MNKQIATFCHPQFGQIRTITMPDGQIGFIGKDVAAALGYSNASKAVIMHVDEEDKMQLTLESSTDAQNGNLLRMSKTTIITESGLYALILSSKLPEARKFKHWVTAEVLPQIRKTGGYIPVTEEDDEKSILTKACSILMRTVEEQKARILDQQVILAGQAPIVDFYEQVKESKGSVLIGELAKMITAQGFVIGRQRLFEWLRKNGYLFQNSTEPLQKWVERGYFEVSYADITTNHGIERHPTTRVTIEGQRYFLDLFKVA